MMRSGTSPASESSQKAIKIQNNISTAEKKLGAEGHEEAL